MQAVCVLLAVRIYPHSLVSVKWPLANRIFWEEGGQRSGCFGVYLAHHCHAPLIWKEMRRNSCIRITEGMPLKKMSSLPSWFVFIWTQGRMFVQTTVSRKVASLGNSFIFNTKRWDLQMVSFPLGCLKQHTGVTCGCIFISDYHLPVITYIATCSLKNQPLSKIERIGNRV